MKKTIFLSFILLTGLLHFSYAADSGLPLKNNLPEGRITSLIVDASVTIILVNEDAGTTAYMKGDNQFMEQISLQEKDGKLVIKAMKKKSFIGKGLIYVPASQLARIEVNSAARIRTLTILPIPELTLSINGDCNIQLATTGKIDLVKDDHYEIDYHVNELSFPSMTEVKKKAY